MSKQKDDKSGNGSGTGSGKARPMTEAERRLKRQAQALRANLARRKDQLRARRAGEADGRDAGIPAARDTSGDDDS